MRTAPNPTKSPHHHPTLTSPAKPLISKALDFSNEIKDLHDEVNSSAKQLKTNNKKFINDINNLHCTVEALAKSLMLHYSRKLNKFKYIHYKAQVKKIQQFQTLNKRSYTSISHYKSLISIVYYTL